MLKIVRTINYVFLTGVFLFILTGGTINSTPASGDEYLAFAEKMPEPIGGLKAIYAKIKYPEIAQKAGIQGKVYVLAFIDENGNVNDVKVMKGIGGGCDEAASTAVKSSKFSPGTNKGKPVKVKLSLVINFKL